MKTLLLFIIVALLFSCNSDEKCGIIEETEINPSILKTNPLFNSNKDALPESLKTIAKSVKIDEERYSFNLSLNEAQRLGATKKEYNDVVEAVKYMNQELDKTKEEGGIIQMPNAKEKATSSLSRGSGKYTTFNVLYSTYNIGTLQSLNANFTGPKTIVAEAGAASLSWSARFNEASKGISFALSGFLISSYEEREVTAPLSTPGQKTSWG